MSELFEPGAPIDVNRLFWFIEHHRENRTSRTYYEMGYVDALRALENFLRDGGYERPAEQITT